MSFLFVCLPSHNKKKWLELWPSNFSMDTNGIPKYVFSILVFLDSTTFKIFSEGFTLQCKYNGKLDFVFVKLPKLYFFV